MRKAVITGVIFRIILVPVFFLFLNSCMRDKTHSLYTAVSPSHSGIHFSNDLTFTEELNPYTYRNFFNGGGVSVGDINNDGLVDIYFTGNQTPNKLYLNKGDFQFEDITVRAGVAAEGAWSTGATMVDINGDGLLDIYVCKSGSPGGKNRHNDLFINNGDLTFTEQSKQYGLDVTGLSTDAMFFDYDRDGDLDMYLLNYPLDQLKGINIEEGLRQNHDPDGGDQLFRNEMISDNPRKKFTEVTKQAGIFSSKIGFGLDVAISDLNGDNWPDIYIANDFFERDYLYLNNRDGTFTELLPDLMTATSLSSMGADIADINHDGAPDIFVADMLPEDKSRVKSKTKFDTWEEYRQKVRAGYHQQFTRNVLQLNNGETQFKTNKSVQENLPLVTFSEIGRLANVEATDWSWTPLIADYNNDGNNDIYVTNGILRDLTDQDYVNNRMSIEKLRSVVEENAPVDILFEEIPSTPISNYVFSGTDSLRFSSKGGDWGLNSPGFSNGAAYADFDNDGDLDLAVNNVNNKASLYRNQAFTQNSNQNWLLVKLNGSELNRNAVGAKLKLWADNTLYFREQIPGRGFQSSVDHRIHFGLGPSKTIDSLVVQWPDGRRSRHINIKANQILTIDQSGSDLVKEDDPDNQKEQIYSNITENVQINYAHQENEFDDFQRNELLTQKYSTEGPAACVADVNNDGRDDLYIGGAKGQSGGIFIQQENYSFTRTATDLLAKDKESEDTDCVWFDANSDGLLDLYVTSGGSEFPASSSALSDRLYINEGGTTWSKSEMALPSSRYESNAVVKAADFNQDGHMDLFTGARLKPFAYGLPVDGNLLLNNGSGDFQNKTNELAPGLIETGLITDAAWFDYDNDKDSDLVIAGEWMPVKIFKNNLTETGETSFTEMTGELNLENTHGLWHSLEISDLDGDGYKDIVAGNLGLNTRFSASIEQPLNLWINDFDENGSIDQLTTFSDVQAAYPVVLRDELLSKIPSIQSQIPTYESYSNKSVSELFSEQKLEKSVKLKAVKLESTIFWNNDGKGFSTKELPLQAEFSPIYGIYVQDFGEQKQILMGGNLHGVKPAIGRYDASYGSVISVNSDREFKSLEMTSSGFELRGEVRGIYLLKTDQNPLILVLRNDDTPLWFKQNH